MKVVNKKLTGVLVVTLMLIEMCSLFLVYKSFSNKETKLDEVKLQIKEKEEMLAIMLEQEDGTYVESSDNTWPTEGYKYDEEKSGCIDINGNKIDGSLTFDGSIATINTSKTSSCYVYFNIQKILSSTILSNNPTTLSDELVGDLYRYQGTYEDVIDNYICFGTNDKDTCVNDTRTYMYRIIGISEEGQLKLIKKEKMDETYNWTSNANANIMWADSNAYNALNSSSGGTTYTNIYVNNSNYPYMSETSEWYNKIVDTDWKYGYYHQGGVSIFNSLGSEIYTSVENNFTNVVTAKIGIMYIHDYYFSNNSYSNNNWIHLYRNDDSVTTDTSEYSNFEWTMTSYAFNVSNGAYYILTTGTVGTTGMTSSLSIRPVFYLNNDIVLKSGTGFINDPYIIE